MNPRNEWSTEMGAVFRIHETHNEGGNRIDWKFPRWDLIFIILLQMWKFVGIFWGAKNPNPKPVSQGEMNHKWCHVIIRTIVFKIFKDVQDPSMRGDPIAQIIA